MTFCNCHSPENFIVPTIFLFCISALSSHSASHTEYFALCRVLSCAPTAPSLPPGNLALSFYIPRSDYGLYYCFPLSALTNTPSQSDFALPYPFHKGLFCAHQCPWLCQLPFHIFIIGVYIALHDFFRLHHFIKFLL